jgi:hypothetical protein
MCIKSTDARSARILFESVFLCWNGARSVLETTSSLLDEDDEEDAEDSDGGAASSFSAFCLPEGIVNFVHK